MQTTAFRQTFGAGLRAQYLPSRPAFLPSPIKLPASIDPFQRPPVSPSPPPAHTGVGGGPTPSTGPIFPSVVPTPAPSPEPVHLIGPIRMPPPQILDEINTILGDWHGGPVQIVPIQARPGVGSGGPWGIQIGPPALR